MRLTLRALRINKGLTLEQSAKTAGISKEALAAYEKGHRYPKINVANRLSVLYGCDIQDIDFLLPG